LVHVLVVDDFAAWRRYAVERLRENPNLRVVDFASDGLEAVEKAEELKPDLILLDIGLPHLNGIEAARQIRKLVPQSKILFVTEESSAYLAQEALSLGEGYVVKMNAETDLLLAVEAVISGKQFVSRHVGGR
jgi:DNA-binding NarL/FixJ family response regulator